VSHRDVVATVEDALRRSGLPPERLLVEVTESTVMEDADAAEVALRAIAALGVAVAIDDFGTGYSSLVYLKRYDLHALKIDRSFVAGMGINADDDAIVASIITLAAAVGAVCIAEGVETPHQHAALVALGCDYAQGYLFGRPVPAEGLGQALTDCARVLSSPPAVS
jgi:EAL domain-containing protein (putative c-di-GMP-specific phosphodiesterase class I)